MDMKDITISQKDIENILREANPGEAASVGEDVCSIYEYSRPLILTGVAILNFVYPPAAGAISAIAAVMDKYCEPPKS